MGCARSGPGCGEERGLYWEWLSGGASGGASRSKSCPGSVYRQSAFSRRLHSCHWPELLRQNHLRVGWKDRRQSTHRGWTKWLSLFWHFKCIFLDANYCILIQIFRSLLPSEQLIVGAWSGTNDGTVWWRMHTSPGLVVQVNWLLGSDAVVCNVWSWKAVVNWYHNDFLHWGAIELK